MCEIVFIRWAGLGGIPRAWGRATGKSKTRTSPCFASPCWATCFTGGQNPFSMGAGAVFDSPIPHPVGRVAALPKDFARLRHKAAWGKCGAPPPTTTGRWGVLKMTLPHHFSRCWLPGTAIALDALIKHSHPLDAHQAFTPVGRSQPHGWRLNDFVVYH